MAQHFIDFRRLARRVSTMLILSAVVLAVWPLLTMLYSQLTTRDLEQGYANHAGELYADALAALGGDPSKAELGDVAAAYRTLVKPGDTIGILTINKINLRVPVVEGSKKLQPGGVDDNLRKGPGRIRRTAMPGEQSNTVVTGHRTTFTHPFWSLNTLEVGNTIVFELPYGTFRYKVTKKFEVMPTELWVTNPTTAETLTLSTCTPRFTARRRLIIQAELQSSTKATAPGGVAVAAGGMNQQ